MDLSRMTQAWVHCRVASISGPGPAVERRVVFPWGLQSAASSFARRCSSVHSPAIAPSNAAKYETRMTGLKALLTAQFWIAIAPAALAQGAVEAQHGMVVAQEAQAARIGVDVLKRGGNAVDAAVATAFAMAVTYPRAGNIGGGGYMVIRLAPGKKGPRSIAIDYRETAPAGATRDMFLDENGNADPRKSRDSALAIGVPGTVAGLALAHARFGSG